jgi:hypothetical protein
MLLLVDTKVDVKYIDIQKQCSDRDHPFHLISFNPARPARSMHWHGDPIDRFVAAPFFSVACFIKDGIVCIARRFLSGCLTFCFEFF